MQTDDRITEAGTAADSEPKSIVSTSVSIEANPVLPEVLDYFGTDLRSAGHYFWQLKGDSFNRSGIWFKDIPFNPEELLPSNTQKGTVKYFREGDYAICAIAGSCIDNRWGTKSVFWTREPVKLGDLKAIILFIPIAKKIIEQMPFEVGW